MFNTLRLHLNRLHVKHSSSGFQDAQSDVAEVFRFYTRITRKLLDAERCSIFISDPESKTVWLKAGTGVPEHGIEVSTQDSVVGEVIETGETVRLDQMPSRNGAHQVTDQQTGYVTRNVLCVPILDPELGVPVGAIEVLNKQGNEGFTAADAEMLRELAEQIRARVSRIYLNQEIFGLSERVLHAASRVLTFSLVGVVAVAVAVMLMLLVWVLVPLFQ